MSDNSGEPEIVYIRNGGTLRPDADLHNADWTKQTWDLPPYKSKAFLSYLQGRTLEDFRALPVYQHAVASGLIKNDIWDGPQAPNDKDVPSTGAVDSLGLPVDDSDSDDQDSDDAEDDEADSAE